MNKSMALKLDEMSLQTAQDMRSKIVALESAMLSEPGHLTASDFKTVHHFAPGIYMREVTIPAGTVVTGEIHKTEHLNILSQGELTVWTEDGMKKLKASAVVKSQPGIKRVGFAHEDSVWITVHHNPENETDPEKLKSLLTAKTFQEFLEFVPLKGIEGEK